MKKKLLSIVFALLLIPVIASAEYFRDIIVTSTEGIWTDSRAYTTLADALVDIAVDGTATDLYIAESETVGTMTVPAYIRLHFVHEGAISVTTQLIINTTQIFSGDRQIFTGVGDIDFIAGSVVRSSWFSDLDEALDVTNDDTLTMVISEAETLTGNCAVGNNVTLRWESPFIITTSAFTMSNIKNIEAGSYQLFTGVGDFDFLAGSVLRSSWFSTLITAQAFTTDENVDLTIFVDQPETTDTVTFDAFQSLAIDPGCLININTGQTITINSSIAAGNYQIFTDDGTVAGAIKQLVIPDDWFAGTEVVTLTSSLDALDITETLATLGITATQAEINTAADGITATAVEINTTSDGDTAKNNHVHAAESVALPRGYLGGLQMSNDAGDTVHDILIAVGECRNTGHTSNIVLASALTKQIDATWALGNDAGGMNDGEAVGNATWYSVHSLGNVDGSVTGAGYDTSVTAANLLADAAVIAAGLTTYRRIGSVLTDGSANILGFTQVGDEFLWDDPVEDINLVNQGATAISRTLSVATGIKVHAIINAVSHLAGGAQGVYLNSLDIDDEAPEYASTPLLTLEGRDTNNIDFDGLLKIRTNTSGQIRSRGTDANTTLIIATLGWIDRCGKDD